MGSSGAAPAVAGWRSLLLTQVLRIVLAFGILTAVPSAYLAWRTGRNDILLIDVVALTAVAVAALATGIPYRIRAVILLGVTYVVGTYMLTTAGVIGQLYLLAVPVLAAILMGLRAALGSLVVNTVTLALIGLVGLADPQLTVQGLHGGAAWVLVSLNLLFVSAALALASALLLQRIERSLADERRLSRSLGAERAALDARNRELETEIAQRHRSEQRQRFQSALLDAVGDAVLATDVHGTLRYLNPAAERLYGWSRDDALGHRADQLTHPEVSTEIAADILDQVGGGRTWSGELEGHRRDGTRFPALVSIAPYRDSRGAAAGTIAVVTDVTELHGTIERLDRSERIRVAFLRATSHELRTPLAAIVGFAETLQRHSERLDDQQRASLIARLTANAERLSRLITDLLDVDRLSSGLVTANLAPRDMRELVRTACAEVDTAGRSITLELEPLIAAVDAPKLERVVVNLVANAVRHAPDAGTVRVGLARRDDLVELWVEDDGDGIHPAYLDAIFEPFVQGPERHHDAKPGTGLGLSLVREMVQLHGGTIEATNHPHGGARFVVHLPIGTGALASGTATVEGSPAADHEAVPVWPTSSSSTMLTA